MLKTILAVLKIIEPALTVFKKGGWITLLICVVVGVGIFIVQYMKKNRSTEETQVTPTNPPMPTTATQPTYPPPSTEVAINTDLETLLSLEDNQQASFLQSKTLKEIAQLQNLLVHLPLDQQTHIKKAILEVFRELGHA
ncbi:MULTISPECIES: hypothetical protein [Helicobacter]|uniref:Uncharacterized protein n=1 Tax=Helicobacter heilmannii TaxID=35817 RepID=A0A0K2XJX4_HELHE|nr:MULTISPECIES: hypothetical protein [Helicobacter]BDQ28129.1 hypothetical protein ASB1_18050 [Helicobacter heilmannii]CRF45874.1 hypothetical protein HHE014_08530 [Helicobacter heilmannii]CRF48569.1 hypothetical protein HHE03_01280 [Helicobacter heilmannii]CRI35314.1 hypothetical protein HHE01_03120 [Helicobacter heilmannii]